MSKLHNQKIKFVTLLSISIAAEMGEGWSSDLGWYHKDFLGNYRSEGIGNGKYALVFELSEDHTRLSIRGMYPRHLDVLCVLRGNANIRITVNVSKTITQIVGDITRRLMPQYETMYARLQAEYESWLVQHNIAFEAAKRIEAASNADILKLHTNTYQGGMPVLECRFYQSGLYGDWRVSSDSVKINAYFSYDEAIEIAKLIAKRKDK